MFKKDTIQISLRYYNFYFIDVQRIIFMYVVRFTLVYYRLNQNFNYTQTEYYSC